MQVSADVTLCNPAVLALRRLQRSSDLLSGAIGGPLVVGVLTPHRNGMTLAAKDTISSFAGVYRQVFSAGFSKGWRGGSVPALAGMPQFTAIGPVFLWTEQRFGSTSVAVLTASLAESLLTYGAQRRNAVIQYNATRVCASEHVALQSMYRLAGPGFVPHVSRNMFAMMGIRLFSPHSYEIVCRVPGAGNLSEGSRRLTADLASSVVAATLSMPFNHAFSWAACTPELERMGYLERGQSMGKWLVGNYRDKGMGLLARDLTIRIHYVALLFTAYRVVERSLLELSRADDLF